MYNLLDYREDGPILHFSFAMPDNEDHEWHHSALATPLVGWFNDALHPLACSLGERLTPNDIVGCVRELAAKELMPAASVDWLGLALFALRAYAVVVSELAEQDSPELEQDCSVAAILAERLCQISEEFVWALDQKIHVRPAEAA